MKGFRAATAVVLGLALTTACGGAAGGGGASADDGVFRVGVKPPDAASGFLLMAQEKNFYAKFGCKVELVTLRDSNATMNALIAGEVDAVEESPSQYFLAVQKGQLEAKIIGSWMAALPYAIYAHKDIGSIKELEGKTLAISSPVGLPAIVGNEILKKAGVDLTKIHYVNAGGNADRYRAVVAGTAAAASSPADYVPLAEKDGVKVLSLSVDTVPDYPRSATIALNSSLEAKPQCAKAYLAGTMLGDRYAYAHPDEAKKLGAKVLKVPPNDPQVTYMHDEIAKKKLVSPDAEISTKSLKYLIDLLVEVKELKAPLDLNSLVDDSYRQEAMKMAADHG